MEKFKPGDRVVVTLRGLQLHARSIPAEEGYTTQEMCWRRLLSKFRQNEEIGVVTDLGKWDLIVKWDSHPNLVSVFPYMVKKVPDEEAV